MDRKKLALLLALATALSVTAIVFASPGVVSATFDDDSLGVHARSSKDISNVVFKFCDGSADRKFDNLSGKTWNMRSDKTLEGVWIKSGNNHSGDGPGYGEFVANPNGCGRGGEQEPPGGVTPPGTGTDLDPVLDDVWDTIFF